MTPSDSGRNVIRVHTDPTRLDPASWNTLLDAQPWPTPFMRLEYLRAMHSTACAVGATGWSPRFITIHRDGRLIGAAPAYLKDHSWGEYVFDWAWAQAYQRHGLRYYPKLVVAVPFTPVSGSRLLAMDETTRQRLIDAIESLASESGASSAHVLFAEPDECRGISRARWSLRNTVQFHWTRDPDRPAANFDTYLASLQRDKRKKIAQERRRVLESGIEFTVHEAGAIDEGLWSFFHHCYVSTYRAHQSSPYLTRQFFAEVADSMSDHWVMFVARRHGTPVAASLVAIDRRRGVAYGRYWGCTQFIPCLHFEACYYQPLQWCIEQGFVRFEGGAQGEHKMARGLMPVTASSAHWISHPEFARAVEQFLEQERAGVSSYVDELREHSPFRSTPA